MTYLTFQRPLPPACVARRVEECRSCGLPPMQRRSTATLSARVEGGEISHFLSGGRQRGRCRTAPAVQDNLDARDDAVAMSVCLRSRRQGGCRVFGKCVGRLGAAGCLDDVWGDSTAAGCLEGVWGDSTAAGCLGNVWRDSWGCRVFGKCVGHEGMGWGGTGLGTGTVGVAGGWWVGGWRGGRSETVGALNVSGSVGVAGRVCVGKGGLSGGSGCGETARLGLPENQSSHSGPNSAIADPTRVRSHSGPNSGTFASRTPPPTCAQPHLATAGCRPCQEAPTGCSLRPAHAWALGQALLPPSCPRVGVASGAVRLSAQGLLAGDMHARREAGAGHAMAAAPRHC
eukprot:360618-Chlamydomonas_euryale.AAC.9